MNVRGSGRQRSAPSLGAATARQCGQQVQLENDLASHALTAVAADLLALVGVQRGQADCNGQGDERADAIV